MLRDCKALYLKSKKSKKKQKNREEEGKEKGEKTDKDDSIEQERSLLLAMISRGNDVF